MTTDNLDEDARNMSLLTASMICGIMLFMAVSVVVNYTRGAFVPDREWMSILVYALSGLTILMVAGARITYDRKVASLKEAPLPSREKVNDFRAISITHMALCELPAIMSTICYMLFGSPYFLVPVAICVVEMILKFPSRQRLEEIANSGRF